jgi:DNA-directed RNA polymerase specialized sigma subunit
VGDSSETTGGETLADAAREEREVAARRLRDELNRDPTDAEIDEWLQQHTEGY